MQPKPYFTLFMTLCSITLFVQPSESRKAQWLKTIPQNLADIITVLDDPTSSESRFIDALSRLKNVNATVIPYQDIGGQALNRHRYDLFLIWLMHGGLPNPNTETFYSLLSLGHQNIPPELQIALCLIYISNPQCSHRCARFKAKNQQGDRYQSPMDILRRNNHMTDEQKNILLTMLTLSQQENPTILLTPNNPDKYDWFRDPMNDANPQQFRLLRQRAQDCLERFFPMR